MRFNMKYIILLIILITLGCGVGCGVIDPSVDGGYTLRHFYVYYKPTSNPYAHSYRITIRTKMQQLYVCEARYGILKEVYTTNFDSLEARYYDKMHALVGEYVDSIGVRYTFLPKHNDTIFITEDYFDRFKR